ncbi:MAG: polysaccharide pyruvyl transferase family protein, partial [Candidatus Methanofastidiosa archaeon]|nr:polysaccharide pyruvyl transferase family protein [Candidatus Methanofastidiosa archaeon]
MKMKKICLMGATISGNKGAESMFQSAVQSIALEIPESTFYLFSYYPDQDSRLNINKQVIVCSGTPLKLALVYPFLAIAYRILSFLRIRPAFERIDRNFANLLDTDLVIDLAGISFADGREKYLPFNIACLLTPILLRKKILKYSQALGPFNNPVNRIFSLFFLPKVDCIIARGKITYSNLRTLNMNNFVLGADSAFNLKIDSSTYMKAKKYIDSDFRGKKIVGISPSSVIEHSCQKLNINYQQIMGEFINYLIAEEDCNVIIIPHSVRKYTLKRKNNDLVVSRRIFERVGYKNRCILIADELSAIELRVLIGYCNYFLASRFHAMVSSLSMKVPTCVCGWSHKYQ